MFSVTVCCLSDHPFAKYSYQWLSELASAFLGRRILREKARGIFQDGSFPFL